MTTDQLASIRPTRTTRPSSARSTIVIPFGDNTTVRCVHAPLGAPARGGRGMGWSSTSGTSHRCAAARDRGRISSMAIPQFSAEYSLYKSTSTYVSARGPKVRASAGAVELAYYPPGRSCFCSSNDCTLRCGYPWSSRSRSRWQIFGSCCGPNFTCVNGQCKCPSNNVCNGCCLPAGYSCYSGPGPRVWGCPPAPGGGPVDGSIDSLGRCKCWDRTARLPLTPLPCSGCA
jgi:hypothetical protein